MKKKIHIRKLFVGLVATLIIIQLFGIDKKNASVDPAKDFITLSNPGDSIATLLKTSCYDCHSNTTLYPWYTNIAPVSWWIQHHITEGRQHLNFSEWGDYSPRKADHKLKECVEMVGEGEMPMYSYTLLHRHAQLNEEQKNKLASWFKSLRASYPHLEGLSEGPGKNK